MDSSATGDVELTKARIEAGQDRPYVLELIFPEYNRHVEFRVLPIVKHALKRVQCLRITLDEVLVSSLWDNLLDDAPKLAELQVILCATPAPILPRHDPLSPAILGGKPSEIRTLKLKNVLLPDIPVPALGAAEDVTLLFEANSTQNFPAYLFQYFPRMCRLRLSGGSIAAPPSQLPHFVADGVRRLKFLDLETCDQDTAPFLEGLPSREIDEIVIAYPDEDSVYAALAGLLHPFNLSFQPDALSLDDFEIHVYSPRLSRGRRFIEARSDYTTEAQVNPLLLNEYFPAQVRWLSIALSLWSLVASWLLAFDDLDEFTVLIDVEDDLSTMAMPVPIKCKSLLRFTLKATVGARIGVPAQWLIALLDMPSLQKPSLVLEDVCLRDAKESCLDGYFLSILNQRR
ncbi:hypothetical protein AURDEDRAFT_174170 [Auricularia subglabra TFB-10046 SS5]|nr:hypothetical protein AURDEDRAFT_174170 [Auricularia subglabra TFB-10046 SS5]